MIQNMISRRSMRAIITKALKHKIFIQAWVFLRDLNFIEIIICRQVVKGNPLESLLGSDKEVHNTSVWINISLLRIVVFYLEYFRSCEEKPFIKRTIWLRRRIKMRGETKVSDFNHTLFDNYVFRLNVSVSQVVAMHVAQTFSNLFQNVYCIPFLKSSSTFLRVHNYLLIKFSFT